MWTEKESGPRGNEGRRRRRRLEKGAEQLDGGLCKTTQLQPLTRCSCGSGKKEQERRVRTKMTQTCTCGFTAQKRSIKEFLPANQSQPLTEFHNNNWKMSKLTFFGTRKEKMSCWGRKGFMCFPFPSISFHLCHNNEHSSDPAHSLGQLVVFLAPRISSDSGGHTWF